LCVKLDHLYAHVTVTLQEADDNLVWYKLLPHSSSRKDELRVIGESRERERLPSATSRRWSTRLA